MKKLFITIFAFWFTCAYAQNKDSILIVDSHWEQKNICSGLLYKYIHFNDNSLFSSNQYISILEIAPDSDRKIEILASPILKETSEIAKEYGAKAAINGSFFKFNYTNNTIDYNSVDYIRKGFKQLAPNTYKEVGKREMHQKGALALLKGKLYILKADELSFWEKYIFAEEVLTSGPILRVNGTDELLLDLSFYTTRHPRSAVAIKKDGTILLVTVDGRAAESKGMSLKELQSITKWLGGEYVINLDGGGSTTMYVKGEPGNGVVNHPTDNKKFDNLGERKVANSILVF